MTGSGDELLESAACGFAGLFAPCFSTESPDVPSLQLLLETARDFHMTYVPVIDVDTCVDTDADTDAGTDVNTEVSGRRQSLSTEEHIEERLRVVLGTDVTYVGFSSAVAENCLAAFRSRRSKLPSSLRVVLVMPYEATSLCAAWAFEAGAFAVVAPGPNIPRSPAAKSPRDE
jgi:hypothetical protein